MQKLLLLAVILLLLPLGFDTSIRADETEPPPVDGELGDPDDDETGDHPWGGEEKSATDNNLKLRTDEARPTSLQQLLYFWLPSYYGIYLENFYPYRPARTMNSHESLFQNQDRRYQLSRRIPSRRER